MGCVPTAVGAGCGIAQPSGAAGLGPGAWSPSDPQALGPTCTPTAPGCGAHGPACHCHNRHSRQLPRWSPLTVLGLTSMWGASRRVSSGLRGRFWALPRPCTHEAVCIRTATSWKDTSRTG